MDHLSHFYFSPGREPFFFNDLLVFFFIQSFKGIYPFRMISLTYQRDQSFQCLFGICVQTDIRLYVFIYLCRIQFYVDDPGLFGIFRGIPGYPIVKTHADGNQEVTLVHHAITGIISMHPQKASIKRVVCWKNRKPQQGRSDRNTCFFSKSPCFFHGP